MNLILNGHPQDIDTSNCANLAELVAAAEGWGSGSEESLVVSVEVDGKILSEDDLTALEERSIEGIREIAIQRRPRREVALSVLAQGAEYTERIAAAILETVAHFRAGRSDLGGELLASVTDSLTVLTGITISVSSILDTEADNLVALQGEILPWLEALVEAQSEEDPIRIGDLLEYEIKPRIEEWGSIMGALAKLENSDAGASSPTLSN